MSVNVRDSEISGLTLRQQAVLPVMVNSPSLAEGARLSGVSERTLRRWLDDDAFRDELARRRQESADLACQALQGVLLRSVSVLAESLEDPDKTVRLPRRPLRHVFCRHHSAARKACGRGGQAQEADR